MLIRHKERKFGKGCVREWTAQRRSLCAQFAGLLKPIDNMLAASPFLLSDRPLFVDYNLYGVLGNYLFNGKTKLPKLTHLRRRQRQLLKSLGTFDFRKDWDHKKDRKDREPRR